ncbi:MAG: hypothetical protein CMH61_02065 [Nanoarchaeota archaeon]|nr:hypothetical protein [Nanoarchaeota archaeon]|tara:strand:- start:1788 stop:2036 length:249 start_codon:yes stop_codon:yes gene_type:complete
MQLNLELQKAIEKINSDDDIKTVLLQLPDGLKPKAGEIQKQIEEKTNVSVVIWSGSCYGACDFPDVKGVDLLVAFGHSSWVY